MQTDDLLLDGAGCDEAIDGDGTLLTDAVGAVAGLVLDGGIPPRVEVDDVVGSRQVESQSTGLQADEEQRLVACLELAHQSVALYGRGAAVEVEVGLTTRSLTPGPSPRERGVITLAVEILFVEVLADECQMARKLTEYQGTMATLPQLLHEVEEGLCLARCDRQFGVDESRMTGGLAQTGNLCQRLQGAFRTGLQIGMACSVLPRPMSSARQAPAPQ